jgi:hypothetical protein
MNSFHFFCYRLGCTCLKSTWQALAKHLQNICKIFAKYLQNICQRLVEGFIKACALAARPAHEVY